MKNKLAFHADKMKLVCILEASGTLCYLDYIQSHGC